MCFNSRPYLMFLGLICLFFAVAERGVAEDIKDQPIKIIASFSILGDIVKIIGGSVIDVETIVGENQDPHIFQPTPRTNAKLANAKGVFINGLGLEGWLERLIDASDYRGPRFIAARGISSLSDPQNKERLDPHVWHSLRHIKTYAHNIAVDLETLLPCHKKLFQKNYQAFIGRCQRLESWAQEQLKTIPLKQRVVVTAHDAFYYLGRDLGIQFEAPQGVSTETEPSARDMARIIRFVKERQIKIVFVESLTNKRLIQQLAEEAGAVVGEVLYADALTACDGPAPTYEKLMRHNLTHIFKAMGTSGS